MQSHSRLVARHGAYLNPNLTAPHTHKIQPSPRPLPRGSRWVVSGQEAPPQNLVLALGRTGITWEFTQTLALASAPGLI